MSALTLPKAANENFELSQIDVRITELYALDEFFLSIFKNLYYSYRKTADICVGTVVTQVPIFISILTESINELHRSKHDR